MADLGYVASYYQDNLGLTPEQARGAARWMQRVESGLNPEAFNPAGGGHGAFGIGQWRGPRQAALKSQYGNNPSLDQQLAFSVSELQGPEARALAALRSTKTEDEAYRAWGQHYERPGHSGGQQREGYYDSALHLNVGGQEGPGQAGTGMAGLALLDSLVRNNASEQKPETGGELLTLLGALGAPQAQAAPAPAQTTPQPLPSSPAPPLPPENAIADIPAPNPLRTLASDGEPATPAVPPAPAETRTALPAAPPANGADLLKSLVSQPMVEPGQQATPRNGGDLLKLLLRGDPEAEGAVAGSQAMQPAVEAGLPALTGMKPPLEVSAEMGAPYKPGMTAGKMMPPSSLENPMLTAFGTGNIGRVEPPPIGLRAGAGAQREGINAAPGEIPATGSGANVQPADFVPERGAKFWKPKPTAVTEAQALDDDLFRSQQIGEAERIEARQTVDALPKEWLNPEIQEKAYHERESRLADAKAEVSGLTSEIERALTPLDEKIHRDATWIRESAPDISRDIPDLATTEEGYVHRKLLGKNIPGEPLDPTSPDIITGGGRSLSRKASGLEQRRPNYVLQDSDGKRHWQPWLLGEKGKPARYGETITDARTGKRYVAKAPTTAEIEQNTNRRYSKNLVANTVDNALRLGRVRRNIELLNKWKPRLTEKGLWLPEGSGGNLPSGYVRVDLPQLRGWAQPHISSVLNELHASSRGAAIDFLDKANKFLIGTMFALPVRHQLNVGAHYTVGRGFDWMYSNPKLATAVREVASQGPIYLRYLKAGAGLRYPSVLNENFYETLLTKLFNDQLKDPVWHGVAKELGMKAADLVKAEYAWSRRALWKVNDVFLTARIMELEGRGLSMQQAIAKAEKEIPNYRIPVEVMRSKTIASLLKSPSVVAFGRYSYGRGKALSEMIKDMAGRGATKRDMIDGWGQAAVLALIGVYGYKLANGALNYALEQTGLAGDKPMEAVGMGPFGILRTGAEYAGYWAGFNDTEKTWAMMLGSLITPPPMTQAMSIGMGGGHDIFTGQPVIEPEASMAGGAMQLGEYALSRINPIGVGLDAMKKGILPAVGPQLGIKPVYEGPPGRVKQMQRGQARRREGRDPAMQFVAPFFQ